MCRIIVDCSATNAGKTFVLALVDIKVTIIPNIWTLRISPNVLSMFPKASRIRLNCRIVLGLDKGLNERYIFFYSNDICMSDIS